MDEYKFVNPSTSVKAFTLPPAYPDKFNFQPPTLPQNWGDKGAEGKQKIAAQLSAWIAMFLIILYIIFKKCRYVSSLPRVCFPLYPFSTILRGTAHTDVFVEVVNLASAEAMWAHFASIAVHHNSSSQVTHMHLICIQSKYVVVDNCRLTGKILFCVTWIETLLYFPPLVRYPFGPLMI